MNCTLCEGSGKVVRVRDDNLGHVYHCDVVTCPQCIRGVTVLGTHEMLRGKNGEIHRPGEKLVYIDYIEEVSWKMGEYTGPVGEILTGVIRTVP